MWQSPSLYSPSSLTSEDSTEQQPESSDSPASPDSPNDEILPNSDEALLYYGIPDVNSTFVTQLMPHDNLIEMNSNTQAANRLRSQRRKTYGGQRFRPYRVPDIHLLFGVQPENYNLMNTQGDIFQSGNRQVESLGTLAKRSRSEYCAERFLNTEQEEEDREDRALPFENDNLSENRLQISPNHTVTSTPSASNQDTDSMDDFVSRFQPYSVQSPSPTVHIENSYNTSNELYSEPVPRSFFNFNTLLRPNHVHDKNSLKSNIKRRTLKILNGTKYYNSFNNDDTLSPLLSLIPDLPLPTISAQKLANNLIKLSRYLKSPNLSDLCCLSCCHMPILPVTGECGHTRCMRCILLNGACPCGVGAPKTLFVNTIVREIIDKMTKYTKKPRVIVPGSVARMGETRNVPLIGDKPRHAIRRFMQSRLSREYVNCTHGGSRPRVPMTLQARHRRARELVCAGKFFEAAPHLARVAASTEPYARAARVVLSRTISAMCHARKRRVVARELSQSVREQSAHSWINPSDLECVLCTNTFSNPVSTPCGHTYCRGCIERSLYYKKKCALCLAPLENFKLSETRDTQFITSILTSIDIIPLQDERDIIPVVTCYVALPGMPCPLFIFDPRYWLMVRRVMESGSRRFGMLAYERGHTFADYGTVLEICDCVVLEDSRCIVSTVGVSRFRVIERRVKDGCDVARIQPLIDMVPRDEDIQDLHLLAAQVSCKALTWLKNMDEGVREEIVTAFGSLPYEDTPDEWWKTPDGPNWLWWLIAILPLKAEIKILILSTRNLLKRMLAVSRTLDVMDSDAFATSSQSDGEPPLSELSNQDWLNRNR